MICDKQDKAETLLENCEKNLTDVLKTIILLDPYDAALIDRGSKSGVDILSLKDVEVHWQHSLISINDKTIKQNIKGCDIFQCPRTQYIFKTICAFLGLGKEQPLQACCE